MGRDRQCPCLASKGCLMSCGQCLSLVDSVYLLLTVSITCWHSPQKQSYSLSSCSRGTDLYGASSFLSFSVQMINQTIYSMINQMINQMITSNVATAPNNEVKSHTIKTVKTAKEILEINKNSELFLWHKYFQPASHLSRDFNTVDLELPHGC